MKITILCYNLSGNSLGRAFLLGELLEKNHNVDIIGPQFDESIWSPMSDERNYDSVKASSLLHRFPFGANKILRKIDGDVVIASKPRTSSYGLGLFKKITSKTPLLLDIDDWESGFYFDKSVFPYIYNIPHLVSCNSFYYTKILEQFTEYADEVTVSNTFLRSKFGGELVPHVRDTDRLSPKKYEKERSRCHLRIPQDQDIVMFAGSPAPYKGVEDLIEAFPLTKAPDCQLYLVGIGDSEYADYLREIAGRNIKIFGQKPFKQIPYWVAAADIIAIPQRDDSRTKGQLPAKLFDAMALGKPILSTNVGDIPAILEDTGVIIEPESPNEINANLSELIIKDEYRASLGRMARRKCVAEYSYDKYAPILDKIVRELV